MEEDGLESDSPETDVIETRKGALETRNMDMTSESGAQTPTYFHVHRLHTKQHEHTRHQQYRPALCCGLS